MQQPSSPPPVLVPATGLEPTQPPREVPTTTVTPPSVGGDQPTAPIAPEQPQASQQVTPPTLAPTEPPMLPPTTTLPPTQAPPPTSAPIAPTPAPTQPCNQDPALRALLLRVLLNDISDPDTIDTEGTSQYQAAQWIIDRDPRQLCPDDPTLRRRYSLAVFYYATRGDRWLECRAPTTSDDDDVCTIDPLPNSGSESWLTEGTECQWGGVVCDDEGRVRVIDMDRNGLSGTLASELQELTHLQFLLLEDGVISGSMPSELGRLTELEVIDLNFNFLQGSIPEELYSLPNLRQLDLNDNELSGTISPLLGQLANLELVQLQNNRLTGMIPTELGLLEQLGTAMFHGNLLSGSVPESLCGFATVDCGTVECDPSCCTCY